MNPREAASPTTRARQYTIVVRGRLWSSPIEGMTADASGDDTVIRGEIVDQSHLQGVLDQLMEQGLELVSVNPSP